MLKAASTTLGYFVGCLLRIWPNPWANDSLRMGGVAMAQNSSQLADAVTNFTEATLVDLPLLAIGRLFDRTFSDELRKARWRA